MSNTENLHINPDCHACGGTAIDAIFGGPCSECERDAEVEAIMQARYAGVSTGRADRAHVPGERLDGRTFGGSTGNAATPKQISFLARLVEEREFNTDDVTVAARAVIESDMPLDKRAASKMIDAILKVAIATDDDGPAWCANRASEKQIAFIESLIAKVDRSVEQFHAECETFEMLIEIRQMNKAAASVAIDMLKKMPLAPVVVEEGPVDGLDLSPLKAYASRNRVRFGIPGSDTRLKVSIGWSRNGVIYVDDAAEYGMGKKYGVQRPGSAYRGDIETELEAILADPHAAMMRYAELTSSCGVCGMHLEDEASIARGMGPVCAKKFA